MTPFSRDVLAREAEAGSKVLLAKYGLPLETIRAELVEGCLYLRPLGIGEGPVPKKAPPVWIMKIGARVHPEMRRRNRTATQAWRERRWRIEVDQWFEHDRAEVVAKNLAFQRVDLSALSDEELVAEVNTRLRHFGTQVRETFEAHGADLVPVGDLLAHCRRWGIADADAAALLQGSSPSSIETAELLAPVGARSARQPKLLRRLRPCRRSGRKLHTRSIRGSSFTDGVSSRATTSTSRRWPSVRTCSSPHCSPPSTRATGCDPRRIPPPAGPKCPSRNAICSTSC